MRKAPGTIPGAGKNGKRKAPIAQVTSIAPVASFQPAGGVAPRYVPSAGLGGFQPVADTKNSPPELARSLIIGAAAFSVGTIIRVDGPTLLDLQCGTVAGVPTAGVFQKVRYWVTPAGYAPSDLILLKRIALACNGCYTYLPQAGDYVLFIDATMSGAGDGFLLNITEGMNPDAARTIIESPFPSYHAYTTQLLGAGVSQIMVPPPVDPTGTVPMDCHVAGLCINTNLASFISFGAPATVNDMNLAAGQVFQFNYPALSGMQACNVLSASAPRIKLIWSFR